MASLAEGIAHWFSPFAEPPAKVTNQTIIDALVSLGMHGVTSIPDVTKGAQSTTFRHRLREKGIPDNVLDAAFALAKGDEARLTELGVPVSRTGDDITVNLQEWYSSLEQSGQPVPSQTLFTGGPAKTTTRDDMREFQAAKMAQRQPAATPAAGPTPQAQPPPDPNAAGNTAAAVNAAVSQAMAGFMASQRQSPEQLRAQIAEKYGWAAGLLDIPDVARVLQDGASGAISIDEVGNRLRATDYYKTTTASERTWEALRRTDPADAAYSSAQRRTELGARATKMGVNIDPERLSRLTELSLRHGWDLAQIDRFMANEIKFDPAGEKQQIFETLKNTAREYLVPLSEGAMNTWAQSIVGGSQTADTFTQYLRDQATSLFPALQVALQDPNMTVRKYLDPYGQVVSKALGINEADIDWTDAKWSRFINQVDPKTNQRTIMSLADVQKTVIADPTYGWSETANGQKAKTDIGVELARSFGYAV